MVKETFYQLIIVFLYLGFYCGFDHEQL